MSNSVVAIFEDEKLIKRFKENAPSSMNYSAERGYAVQLLNNNSYLMKVATGHPTSLVQAVTNVAAIGLSLNPAEKQAYLIPRTIKADGKFQARIFLEPSYMGLIKLAIDSGSIEWVQANCVYANDEFIDNGAGLRPEHKYQAFSKDRGEFVGVYCVAKTSQGDYLTTIMPSDEVIGIRDRSESWKSFKAGKAKTGGPWQSDFNEQAKKTVVRRGFKTWPRSGDSRMANAVEMSNQNEGFEPIATTPDLKGYTPEQKEYFDQLISNNDALGMFVFRSSFDLTDATSDSASAYVSLMHSFEKGTKGKYGEIVRDLNAKGRVLAEEIAESIEEGLRNDDDMAVIEVSEDLSNDEIKAIDSLLSIEASSEFNKLIHKLKQAS